MRTDLDEGLARMLLAVAEYAAEARIDELGNYLANHHEAIHDDDGDKLSLVARVILYMLPETTSPVRYLSLISALINNEDMSSWADCEFKSMEESLLPSTRVIPRATKLMRSIEDSLSRLGWSNSTSQEDDKERGNTSLLSNWIIVRARRVESHTGVIALVADIFNHQEYIPQAANQWYSGVCVPLRTYITKFHSLVSLQRFESNTPLENVQLLLSHTSSQTIKDDTVQLVKDYLNYSHSWDAFWHWLIQRASHDFAIMNQLLQAPPDLLNQADLTKACLAAIYQSRGTNDGTLKAMNKALASLNRDHFVQDGQESLSKSTLESLESLSIDSPAYELSTANYELLQNLVRAAAILHPHNDNITIKKLCEIKSTGEPAEQRSYITRVLYDQDLTRVSSARLSDTVRDITWLIRDSTILARVSFEDVAKDILEAGLLAGQFEFVKSWLGILPQADVESIVLRVFNTFFDRASNGNKTRGYMKSAQATLDTMSEFATHSEAYTRCQRLIDAAHALCFYSLTLKQGVPFKPVDLKIHDNPLDIIQKTLSLNNGSYRRPEEFIKIAQDIIEGTNNETTMLLNSTTVSTDIRIKVICIQEALINNDFDTAYDYCMDYLVGNKVQAWRKSAHYQEIAWTTCFLIGKYCSADWDVCPIEITRKQMKILSIALKICPKENLGPILKAWKLKEIEMNEYDTTPGSSAASSVIQFPTAIPDILGRRPTEGNGHQPHTAHHSASRIARALASSASAFAESGEDPLNLGAKKDQISNLLVNGIGWAIGANKN